jgi:hypothetical protein
MGNSNATEGNVDGRSALRQLVRAVGAGHGALQRELKHLTDMVLIVRRAQGHKVLVSGEFADSDLFRNQRSDHQDHRHPRCIRSALAPLGAEIQIAFLYGSVAR